MKFQGHVATRIINEMKGVVQRYGSGAAGAGHGPRVMETNLGHFWK